MTDLTANTGGIRVFVYGTLKRGHPNHGALTDAEFLGRCYIEGAYKFYDLGWYPAVVPANDGTTQRIYGEVYRIDEDILAGLDIIEGHPSYYAREKMDTPWKKAWVYLLPVEYNDEGHPEIEGGVWQGSTEELEFVANG